MAQLLWLVLVVLPHLLLSTFQLPHLLPVLLVLLAELQLPQLQMPSHSFRQGGATEIFVAGLGFPD